MLHYYPNRGEVLLCDYRGFKEPEMVKVRPVIVISPRFRSRPRLCTVVPLSTTAPDPVESFHMTISFPRLLPEPFNAPFHWIKADMINTVSMDRLSLIRCGRLPNGQRKYYQEKATPEQLAELESKIQIALGIKQRG
ncbi:MAG: type II toxin-antitoxin system PemK/MazF family toxin [Alphaproteobacteria bacterium]|nr:type II toxin-antitoxin system PemK/MazF family toxin [Alphaproteobacteria bacterium]